MQIIIKESNVVKYFTTRIEIILLIFALKVMSYHVQFTLPEILGNKEIEAGNEEVKDHYKSLLAKWEPQHIAVGADYGSNSCVVYIELMKLFRRDAVAKNFLHFRGVAPNFQKNIKNFHSFQKQGYQDVVEFRSCLDTTEIPSLKSELKRAKKEIKAQMSIIAKLKSQLEKSEEQLRENLALNETLKQKLFSREKECWDHSNSTSPPLSAIIERKMEDLKIKSTNSDERRQTKSHHNKNSFHKNKLNPKISSFA